MTLDEVLHALRAAADVSGANELVVFGSQAILFDFPEPPLALRQSIEVDVVASAGEHLSEKIDGAIGELSDFHRLHGYYAHGVGFDRASLIRILDSVLAKVKRETPPDESKPSSFRCRGNSSTALNTDDVRRCHRPEWLLPNHPKRYLAQFLQHVVCMSR